MVYSLQASECIKLMKYFFWVILALLLSSCAPKETPYQGPVDLDSITIEGNSPQPHVDMTLMSTLEKSKSSESTQQNNSDEEREAPPTVILNAQTMPISEPHTDSPGGVIADTLRIFQCENLNAQGQDNFFLHVLNYRIHTLGAHPLCEVIQVTDLHQEEIKKEIFSSC